MEIYANSASPTKAVTFSKDGRYLVEANYLGFVTVRNAYTGAIENRYMPQTGIVEAVRFEESDGKYLMIAGAGFEGNRDYGVAKLLEFPTGNRFRELAGHTDDITDVVSLNGLHQRVITVGLDRRVIVHDLSEPKQTWIWEGSAHSHLNVCSPRPKHSGHFAVAGDSYYTYIIDADQRQIIAKVETVTDSNGLAWSQDGRYLLVGNDDSHVLYFDAQNNWKLVASAQIGDSAKRMIVDPFVLDRCLVACYDGRIWSISLDPAKASSSEVIVDRKRGLWGNNIAASSNRLGISSFCDRAYLVERGNNGLENHLIGSEPKPSFGANWVAINKTLNLLAVTHDDSCIRIRDCETGQLRQVFGSDSLSLYMGACFHPSYPVLATVDFYGELWIYDINTGKPVWHRALNLGPGVTVKFSDCGRFLAIGFYSKNPCIFDFGNGDRPIGESLLESPNQGVIKNVFFTPSGVLLAACGDGSVVVYVFDGQTWRVVRHIQGKIPMAICNGVVSSPDSRKAFVVCRDQSLRGFDLETGECQGIGLVHTRSVKTVSVSECGIYIATGSYDRSILVWHSDSLTVRLPPLRNANSGISCVQIYNSIIYSCSFDGFVSAWCVNTGKLNWSKSSLDSSQGK